MATLGGSVSRRYARALLQIGVEQASFETLGRELDDLAATYAGSPQLHETMANPIFKTSEKRAILGKLLQRLAPSRLVHNFALLLLERGRISSLPAIARAYRELCDVHAGRVRALVTSATPLGPAELSSIQRALERRTGKKVLLEPTVDPDLIGGVIARVGDLILDGSVRTLLSEMRRRFAN
jgi:F-type H+-transporting ATPase subunit delta